MHNTQNSAPCSCTRAATLKPPFRASMERQAWAGLFTLLLSHGAWGAEPPDATVLSLDELMAIEVTSAAKKPQRLADAATAIHVLGREDIRRSGATSLPELLRHVPGVQVSRIDASRYAVGIRGFNSRYSGKLLVLLDGRTLYSPVLSGTLWEAQDVVLEDVERVEVILGPGGTLWGAGAMNGVINILTRRAKDTQGMFVEAKAGDLESGVAVRFGTKLGDAGHLRAYAKLDEHDNLDTASGQDAHDAWRQKRAGFRADMTPDARDTLTLQGDAYETKADATVLSTSLVPPTTGYVPDTSNLSGANLLFRWQRQVDETQSWQFQAYVDRFKGREKAYDVRVDTVDLDWQHRFLLTPSHELTWGLGARQISDELNGGFTVSFPKNKQKSQVYSAFLQDEIKVNEQWRLTLGSKFEHNSTTGFEYQPSARVLWRASATDTVWGAVSRAVQTPTRSVLDSEVRYAVVPYPVIGQAVLGYSGNPDLVAQELVSREIGYRGQFGPDLNVNLNAFYNTYDNLISNESQPLAFVPYAFVGEKFSNGLKGKTYGFEATGNWQVNPDWRLKASYSRLEMTVESKPGYSGQSTFGRPGSSPKHMVRLHSSHNLGNNLELDAYLNFVSSLFDQVVDRSTVLDLRLGWRPMRNLELSLTGRNLLQKRHSEFHTDDVTPSHIPRSFLLQARWKF